MGYIIIEPGMKVAEIGLANPLSRNNIQKVVDHAMAAEMLGMKLVYLEAGSGAPEHVPLEMISEVKAVLNIPLIVGGGIIKPEQAKAVSRAGADIIVTGTIFEMDEDFNILGDLVRSTTEKK